MDGLGGVQIVENELLFVNFYYSGDLLLFFVRGGVDSIDKSCEGI